MTLSLHPLQQQPASSRCPRAGSAVLPGGAAAASAFAALRRPARRSRRLHAALVSSPLRGAGPAAPAVSAALLSPSPCPPQPSSSRRPRVGSTALRGSRCSHRPHSPPLRVAVATPAEASVVTLPSGLVRRAVGARSCLRLRRPPSPRPPQPGPSSLRRPRVCAKEHRPHPWGGAAGAPVQPCASTAIVSTSPSSRVRCAARGPLPPSSPSQPSSDSEAESSRRHPARQWAATAIVFTSPSFRFHRSAWDPLQPSPSQPSSRRRPACCSHLVCCAARGLLPPSRLRGLRRRGRPPLAVTLPAAAIIFT